MKRKDRFQYARMYLLRNFDYQEQPSMRHPMVVSASIRYGLSEHQTRRLVAELKRQRGTS